MEKTKICPNCLKKVNEDATKCECGYEFYLKPKEDEIAPSNTVVLYDPVPNFVWYIISLILPPLGFFLAYKWQEKWNGRSKQCLSTALVMSIVWFVVAIILLFINIGVKNGDVLI